jgi:hypothetical protein
VLCSRCCGADAASAVVLVLLQCWCSRCCGAVEAAAVVLVQLSCPTQNSIKMLIPLIPI